MSSAGAGPRPGSYGTRRELVYENEYHNVYRVETVLGARSREFFVTDYGERAAVVVVRDDHVLLVRQRRLFLEDLSWEIPGGSINEGETPEQAAMRECLEEAGIRCVSVEPLLRFHPGLDTLYNPSFLFLARPADEPERPFDHAEVEHRSWVPLSRCLEMIARGQIVDSISILGLFAFRLRGPGAAA